MELKDRFQALIDKYKDDPEYIAEGMLLDISEQFLGAMESQGINRSQLAEKLGCSNAYVTKLFNGSENFTIKKAVQIASVLGAMLDIAVVPNEYDVKRYYTYSSKKINISNKTRGINFTNSYEPNFSVAA